MGRVPRHALSHAGGPRIHNAPLPIGFDKTISQPFIVALMTDLRSRGRTTRAEVGTGLGYQAAVLGQLVARAARRVIEELAVRLRQSAPAGLRQIGIPSAMRAGRSSAYDKLIVRRPPSGASALSSSSSGRPDGAASPLAEDQKLTVVEKDAGGRTHVRELMSVRFGLLETVR